MTAEDCGLGRRYEVAKVDDPTGKHADCRYFVLDPTHDDLAVETLRFYAQVARTRGRGALADDLEAWVGA